MGLSTDATAPAAEQGSAADGERTGGSVRRLEPEAKLIRGKGEGVAFGEKDERVEPGSRDLVGLGEQGDLVELESREPGLSRRHERRNDRLEAPGSGGCIGRAHVRGHHGRREALASFATAGGSAVGRDHVRRNRNNQDAVAIVRGEERIVAVVTDGCGEAARSEIGACLGASFLAHWLARAGEGGRRELIDGAVAALEDHLRALTRGPWGAERERDFVAGHLLFGFLAAVVDPERTFVFGIGDGVIWADGRTIAIDPGPENAPPYLAYRLVEQEPSGQQANSDPSTPLRSAQGERGRVHLEASTREVRSILIGTDGLLPLVNDGLDSLASDPAIAKNPALLQRRLVGLRDHDRAFQDDATAALIVRLEEA